MARHEKIAPLTPEAKRYGSQEIADKVAARRAYLDSLLVKPVDLSPLASKPLSETRIDHYDPVFDYTAASHSYFGRV